MVQGEFKMTKFEDYIHNYVKELREEGLSMDEIEDYLLRQGHLDEKYLALYEAYYC